LNVRLLLDTHLLIWVVSEPDRLSPKALELMNDDANDLFFSAASIWEIAIKASYQRADFMVNVPDLHSELLRNGYREVAVSSGHTFAVVHLPHLHKDPFDRMLLAQAMREDLTLVTADATLASYPGPILKV
jgi:PIN domain nuclease of toxin-antitoxin system